MIRRSRTYRGRVGHVSELAVYNGRNPEYIVDFLSELLWDYKYKRCRVKVLVEIEEEASSDGKDGV